MLLFAWTTTTALGQTETTPETFAKAHKTHAKAELDYTAAIKREPDTANLYQQRGVVRFFQLKFTESLADFDKFIEMMPSREPYHWQRGLVHYYAGKYKAGRKQFESHQTVNTQDVENAVWHYLCISKIDGVKEAEKQFIKITSDRRVPLKEIHALFAGKGTERQVLAANSTATSTSASTSRHRATRKNQPTISPRPPKATRLTATWARLRESTTSGSNKNSKIRKLNRRNKPAPYDTRQPMVRRTFAQSAWSAV